MKTLKLYVNQRSCDLPPSSLDQFLANSPFLSDSTVLTLLYEAL